MATVRKTQCSFTTGVISPAMYARTDLQKYASAMKRGVNAVVHCYGGVSKRPGTYFVDELEGDGILIPFIYSVTDSYVLAFYATGEDTTAMRVYRGDTPLSVSGDIQYFIPTPYTPAQLTGIKFAQSADVIFLVHPDHPVMKLTRLGETNWTFSEVMFDVSKVIGAPTNLVAVPNAKFVDPSQTYVATTTYYKVSAVNARGLESEPSASASAATLSTWPSGAMVTLSWDKVPGADHYEVYKNENGYYAWIGSADTNSFIDDCIAGDSSQGPKESRDPFNPPATPENLTISREGSESQSTTVYVRATSISKGGAESAATPEVRAYGPVEHLSFSCNLPQGTNTCRFYWKVGADSDWGYSDFTVGAVSPAPCTATNIATNTKPYHGVTHMYEIGIATVNSLTSESELSNTLWLQFWTDPNYPSDPRGVWLDGSIIRLAWTRVNTTTYPNFRIYLRDVSNPSAPGPWYRLNVDSDYVSEDDYRMYYSITKANFQSMTENAPVRNANEFAPGNNSGAPGIPPETTTGYPGAVGIYQQRLVFGRTNAEPHTVWLSETGAFDSMAVSYPLRDSDAITATVDSKQMNEIRHFISLKTMLVLTNGAEFSLSGGSNGNGAVTPTTISFSVQSYWGSSDVPPIVTGNTVLLVLNSGLSVRDLHYTLSEDGYSGEEISVLAEHLLTSPIRDWAYQQHPFSLVWICREDGKLLSMTYNREQEVIAWTEHESLMYFFTSDATYQAGKDYYRKTGDTYTLMIPGKDYRIVTDPTREQPEPIPANTVFEMDTAKFRSVSSIRKGGEDQVYFLVKRGARYFIEMQKYRHYGDDQKEAFFVDCGRKQTSTTAFTHVTGLKHLIGKQVVALADGAVVEDLTVYSEGTGVNATGAVDLPHEAKTAIVGLPYEFLVETVDPEIKLENGSVAGEKRNVVNATVTMRESKGLEIGPTDSNMVLVKPPYQTTWGNASPLFSGEMKITLPGDHRTGASVVMRQKDPLPITILGITTEVSVW